MFLTFDVAECTVAGSGGSAGQEVAVRWGEGVITALL